MDQHVQEYFKTEHYRLVYPETMPPHYDYVDHPPEAFLPMSDPLPVRGVRGPEGDAVLQYLEDEQVFFGYFQTQCHTPYHLLFDSFAPCAMVVCCLDGTFEWEVGYQDEILRIPKQHLMGFPLTKGLSRFHFGKGFHRCYFFGMKGDFLDKATYEYYMISSIRDHFIWDEVMLRPLPAIKFTKPAIQLLHQLIASTKKHLAAILEMKGAVYTLLGDYHTVVSKRLRGGGLSISERIRIQATRYIQEHLRNPELSVAMITDKLCISKSSLYKAFSEAGLKVLDVVVNHRMQHAKKLLKTTNLSIADIGVHCGYFTPTTFLRVFKQNFSVSPSEYRLKKKNKTN